MLQSVTNESLNTLGDKYWASNIYTKYIYSKENEKIINFAIVYRIWNENRKL